MTHPAPPPSPLPSLESAVTSAVPPGQCGRSLVRTCTVPTHCAHALGEPTLGTKQRQQVSRGSAQPQVTLHC